MLSGTVSAILDLPMALQVFDLRNSILPPQWDSLRTPVSPPFSNALGALPLHDFERRARHSRKAQGKRDTSGRTTATVGGNAATAVTRSSMALDSPAKRCQETQNWITSRSGRGGLCGGADGGAGTTDRALKAITPSVDRDPATWPLPQPRWVSPPTCRWLVERGRGLREQLGARDLRVFRHAKLGSRTTSRGTFPGGALSRTWNATRGSRCRRAAHRLPESREWSCSACWRRLASVATCAWSVYVDPGGLGSRRPRLILSRSTSTAFEQSGDPRRAAAKPVGTPTGSAAVGRRRAARCDGRAGEWTADCSMPRGLCADAE
jgi:hypothetical protein